MENTIDKNYKTAILLATYNGELYLKEQLESLFNQTYKNWTLYIHDDGSKDNTINIIKSYQQQHKNIKLFDYPATGGAKNKFRHLNKVIKDNLATFRMLETLNYGSFLKFIYYKYKYKRKLREIK